MTEAIEIDYRMYSSDSIFFSYWNEAQIVKDNLIIFMTNIGNLFFWYIFADLVWLCYI